MPSREEDPLVRRFEALVPSRGEGSPVRHFEALVPSRKQDPEVTSPRACEFYAALAGKAQRCTRKVLWIADTGSSPAP